MTGSYDTHIAVAATRSAEGWEVSWAGRWAFSSMAPMTIAGEFVDRPMTEITTDSANMNA